MAKAKPFIKWAGGKTNILRQLEASLPDNFDQLNDVTYIEPFLGGGAMMFHMLNHHHNIRRVVVNDINTDLTTCYSLVRNRPAALIQQLKDIEDTYYAVGENARQELFLAYRSQYNNFEETTDEVRRAALFIFLNHTCFNGLYRVNQSGRFNVPYGKYKRPVICDEEQIMLDSQILRQVDFVILNGDYSIVSNRLSPAPRNNFMYLDPPYRPISNTAYFKEYSASPFGDKEQEQLKAFCDRLGQRGCLIMASNSDSRNEDGTSYFEQLYQGYDFKIIEAPRFINAYAESREMQTETLMCNYFNER